MPQQPLSLFSADLAPDGKLLATADIGGTVKLWDFPRHEEIQTLNIRGEDRTALAFSPSGKLLALSSARDETTHSVSILNLVTGQTIIELPHTNSVQSIAFTPDEKRLIAWESGRNVLVWDLESRQPVFRFPVPVFGSLHQGKIAVSSNGRVLAIGGLREVRGIDLSTGQTKFTISSFTEGITAMAFSPEGGPLAVGTGYVDGSIRLFDSASGNPAGDLMGHNAWVSSLRFTSDGKRLISGSADQALRVWDVTHLNTLLTLKGHLAEVWFVALAPDGQSAVSGGKDGSLLGWDFRREAREDSFAILPKPLLSVEFSADSRVFYGINTNGSVSVWERRSLREVGSLVATGTNITRVLSSHDGRFLAIGTSGGEIRILEGATRLLVTNLPGGGVGVMPVGFLAGERTLVSVNNEGVIDQWDTASWRKRSSATYPSGTSAEFAALSDAPNTGFLLSRTGATG
jgi:WD40 repeat protein